MQEKWLAIMGPSPKELIDFLAIIRNWLNRVDVSCFKFHKEKQEILTR